MLKIYATLEKGGIGIFESPTGTGKSLSVICSALQWLKDAEARDIDGKALPDDISRGNSAAEGKGPHSNLNSGRYKDNHAAFDVDAKGQDEDDDAGAGSALPSWLKDLTRTKSDNDREARAKRVQEQRRKLDRMLADVLRQQDQSSNNGGKKVGGRPWSSSSSLNGRGSGWTGGAGRKRPRSKTPPLASQNAKKAEKKSGSASAGAAASANGGGEGSGLPEEGEDASPFFPCRPPHHCAVWQILYVSRTHSQTSQFVNEVKKTAFARGVRCASLGSRRTLCGNGRVSSLKTDGKMRDAQLAKSPTHSISLKPRRIQRTKRNFSAWLKLSDHRRRTPSFRTLTRQALHACFHSAFYTRPSALSSKINSQTQEEEGTTDGCPLLTAEGQREFPYRALASVRDIEELAELGEQEGTCAYYGARKAAKLAQLVVMPYAALLSREARDAMGVRLEGAVVVVDEAHNIVEAINAVHSKKLVLSELERAHSQLAQYEEKYGARLKGSNAFYVGNILKLLRAFLTFLKKGQKKLQTVRAEHSAAAAAPKGPTTGKPAVDGGDAAVEAEGRARSEMLEINDFLFRAGLDNVNLFKLQRYMRRSEISRKVMGFMDLSAACVPQLTVATAGGGGNLERAFVSKHFSALQAVEGFLDALTNASRDGRILATYGGKEGGGGGRGISSVKNITKQQQQQDDEEPSVKFLMLNPAVHFDEIVKKARALVLVGGTMQPTGDLVRQLFSTVEPSRLEVFSCGHVIPRENLLPLCVSKGPSGKTFNFTYNRRGSDEQLDELGRLMTNVCKFVPGGVVCFLASTTLVTTFAPLCSCCTCIQVLQRWKASGTFRQLNKLKSIFSEPRSAKDVDVVLRDFSVAARAGAWKKSAGDVDGGGVGGSSGGALLLSVVGAKMSEGINFSDDLARCVVMVGLPYPDKRDPELKQKMAYLDKATPGSGGQAGRDYYSSICMRAVNQSIGRSIRHAGDYASILLVDERYRGEQVVRLLPRWIAERVVKPANFGQTFVALRQFFKKMHASL
ncbi:unnamed protein product [Scytosiphon promiscuus]